MDLLLAFVLAMSVTMALVPVLMRVAGRLQVLDAPGPRKVHQAPIPRIGGLAMVAGAATPLVFWLHDDARLPACLVAATLLLVVGVWDDRAELSYLPKFAAQLVAAAVVMTWGGVLVHSITLTERIELPTAAALPLTMLFLVGVTNAINLADGLDGLAGGTTFLSCCAMALLALTINEHFVATVSVIVAGSILGFLRFNTYPARIFMGDGGSQVLGLTVAVLAVMLTQAGSTPISAALPVLLLGLPILDTLTVMLQRISEGRSPFTADKNHIHHRLLALGFRHHEAVVVIYLMQAALFVSAWYLRYESDFTILVAFGLFATTVLGLLQVGGKTGWRWRGRREAPLAAASSAGQDGGWAKLRRALPFWALVTAATCAAIYVLRTAWIAWPIPPDVGWLTAVLAAVLLVAVGASLLRPVPAWLMQGALYVGAVAVVYLQVTATPDWPVQLEMPLLGLLVGSVMLSFRLTLGRRFTLTPLDFLVVFVALALPNLPGSIATPREIGFGAVKLLVLFYAIELLMNQSIPARLTLNSIGIAVLGVISVRALL